MNYPKRVGDRGLLDYASFLDINGNGVALRTSSGVTTQIWICCNDTDGNDTAPLLNIRQARALRDGLDLWLRYHSRKRK